MPTRRSSRIDRDGGHLRRAALLELDGSLGIRLSEAQRAAARRELIAPTMLIEAGERFDPRPIAGAMIVLVVSGTLGLRTVVGNGHSLEILTRGFVCSPLEENPASFVDSALIALTTSRVAILDDRICQWPPIMSEIVSRLCQRSRSALAQKALDSQAGLDRRVLFCLWHLAERHGHCRPDGVEVPVPLTHELLAEVMGAARPSITTALAHLASTGIVTRTHDRGWLLRPDSIDQLFDGDSTPLD
jgi:hypothetical protein